MQETDSRRVPIKCRVFGIKNELAEPSCHTIFRPSSGPVSPKSSIQSQLGVSQNPGKGRQTIIYLVLVLVEIL